MWKKETGVTCPSCSECYPFLEAGGLVWEVPLLETSGFLPGKSRVSWTPVFFLTCFPFQGPNLQLVESSFKLSSVVLPWFALAGKVAFYHQWGDADLAPLSATFYTWWKLCPLTPMALELVYTSWGSNSLTSVDWCQYRQADDLVPLFPVEFCPSTPLCIWP